MYDRRPASRATVGTPTVIAGSAPRNPVRGSNWFCIITPLQGGLDDTSPSGRNIVDARRDFKRNTTNGYFAERLFRLRPLPFPPSDATVDECAKGRSRLESGGLHS